MKCPIALATVPSTPEHTNSLGYHLHTCVHPAEWPHGHHLCGSCGEHWTVPADLRAVATEPQGALW